MLDGLDEGGHRLRGLLPQIAEGAGGHDGAIEVILGEIHGLDEQRYGAHVLVAHQGLEMLGLLGFLVEGDQGGQGDLGALGAHAGQLVEGFLLLAHVAELARPGHGVVGISGTASDQRNNEHGQYSECSDLHQGTSPKKVNSK